MVAIDTLLLVTLEFMAFKNTFYRKISVRIWVLIDFLYHQHFLANLHWNFNYPFTPYPNNGHCHLGGLLKKQAGETKNTFLCQRVHKMRFRRFQNFKSTIKNQLKIPKKKKKQDNKLNFRCNFGQLLRQFILVKVHIISDKNIRVASLK